MRGGNWNGGVARVVVVVGVWAGCLWWEGDAAGQGAPGSGKVAVLEFDDSAGLSDFERGMLSDDVRAAALALSKGRLLVMTRENMLTLLPPGTTLAQCQSETRCEVEMGRKVGADVVVVGTVGRFAGELTASMKMYDTHSGALLAQEGCAGRDLKALRESVQAKARDLFGVLNGPGGEGRAAPGGLDFQVTALPAVPRVEAPRVLDARLAEGMDFRAVDVEALEALDAAVRLDEGGATPAEKEQAWRDLAKRHPSMKERAIARAEEWRRYREAEEAREKARAAREEARRKDFERLWRLLQLRVVPEESKRAWAARFVEAYGTSLSDNPDCPRLAPWLERKTGCERGPSGYVWIPAGRFRMGSPDGEAGRDGDEGPVHEVEITRGFWMKGTEVTQGEWEEVMGNNPSKFQACGKGCPVEQVSWWDAVAYCNALSRREGLEECYEMRGCKGRPGGGDYFCEGVGFRGLGCRGYRLPTEAEWEYAARAGSETALYTGGMTLRGKNHAPELDGIAWYGGNSGVSYEGGWDCSGWPEKQYASTRCGPHPVGQKRPNGWGLYDMLGNVWEWVWDWYGGYSSGRQVDPLGPETGRLRVGRGGSWRVQTG